MSRVRALVLLAVALLALPFAWSCFAKQHAFCAGGACVRYQENLQAPGMVRFDVRNRRGNPMSGIAVNTLSDSGWAQGAVTGSDGTATLQPGELEILAVQLNGRVIRFWPSPVDLLAGPDTGSGVRFSVVME